MLTPLSRPPIVNVEEHQRVTKSVYRQQEDFQPASDSRDIGTSKSMLPLPESRSGETWPKSSPELLCTFPDDTRTDLPLEYQNLQSSSYLSSPDENPCDGGA